jgi:4-amino-4-deoxy-L-arabinose transferase-like glycosyltransferase
VFATCLLGAIVWSRAVGLAAGLALAAEFQAVAWSIQGWRDDTFMMCVTAAAAALVLLSQRPSPGASTLAGFSAAAACLTRISALSFVVPALLWIALFAPRERRADSRKAAATAGLIAALLVAPYLVNCWRATGDPFYALNYHTRYYRSAEGKALDESVSALDYVSAKLAARPATTIDTAAQGLTVVPFRNKWQGWTAWSSAIGPVLRGLGALGVLVAIWSPSGRLLLLMLVTSLIPYAVTWSVGGGGEWRFTQHVYPIYLVCAFQAAAILLRFAASVVRHGFGGIALSRREAARAAAVAAIVGLAWIGYETAPILVAREAIAADGELTIAAGPRDRLFFSGPWSAPIADGSNVTVRVAQSELASMRLPLEQGDYTMTLRIDPPLTMDPARQPRLEVFLNRTPLADLDLTRNPARMGTYRIHVPAERVSRWNRLDLLASHTVRAGDAGAPFRSLPPDSPVAFRLWYVRVVREEGGR